MNSACLTNLDGGLCSERTVFCFSIVYSYICHLKNGNTKHRVIDQCLSLALN